MSLSPTPSHADVLTSKGGDQPRSRTRFFDSSVAFSLWAALAWVLLYNRRFWSDTLATVAPHSAGDIAFLVSVFGVLWALHALLLLLIPGRHALKAVAAFLFLAASVGAYFADTYGISIDREIIRNLFDTDRREALALFNTRFAFYFCVLGLIPAILILRLRLRALTIKRSVIYRAGFVTIVAALAAVSFALLGAHYASFIREHKNLRFLVTPANIVYATSSYVSRTQLASHPSAFTDLESPVVRAAQAPGARPLLLLLVIGETARSQNFQLGGYARPTTPELMRRQVHYFGNVYSCGTSTSISLPCMFSGAGRASFDVVRAQHSTNLLDALSRAGFRVQWRDNNSGCKGICSRVASIDYTVRRDDAFCGKTGCYDEVMLEDLPRELAQLAADSVIVFHQAGSHGPAYSERYPKRFEIFKPVCYGNELSRCAVEHVVNAYDNSILYTDYNLARQIDMLRAISNSVDSALIYVSDHGESLGERGMYLHGAPYVLAPDQQIRVPFVLWMSEGYRRRFAVSDGCVSGLKDKRFSHDDLYHTVLGMLGVTTARYNQTLDMLSACRAPAVSDRSARSTASP